MHVCPVAADISLSVRFLFYNTLEHGNAIINNNAFNQEKPGKIVV